MKSWDANWEKVFQSQEWGKYPPEELIRFVAKNYYSAADRSKVHFLDLGCGPGPGAWYLSREGFSVKGIDGSATAIDRARKRFSSEGLAGEFTVGDFNKLPYNDGEFDAVIDLAAIQHNPMANIREVISEASRVLKKGGLLFLMMISKCAYGDGIGREIEPGTFTDINEGPAAGKGTIHFFSEQEIRQLLANFKIISLELSMRSLDAQKHWHKSFVVVAQK